MCEELKLNSTEEETVEPVTAPPAEEIPAEKWWNGQQDPAEYVDVTPELPPQPIYQPPVQPQPQPIYQQPVQPQQPQYQPPVQPVPPQYIYQQPVAPGQPIYQQPYMPYPPQPIQPKNDLSLFSLIVGIVALFIGYWPMIGWIADIAAIILGVISKSKGDKTVRGTLGIVFGSIGAAFAFLFIFVLVMFMMEDISYMIY